MRFEDARTRTMCVVDDRLLISSNIKAVQIQSLRLFVCLACDD